MVGVGDVVGGLADEADEAPDEGTGQDGAWFAWRGYQEMYLNSQGGSSGKDPLLLSKVRGASYPLQAQLSSQKEHQTHH